MSKLFSVIVLYYNQVDYWKEAIDSVIMQDYPEIQIIFADDGSKNVDFAAISGYVKQNAGDNIKEFIFQRNSKNGKTSKNCNSGLKHCTGEYIVILDGDDAFYDKEVLSNFAESFESLDSSEMIVTSRMKMYDEHLKDVITEPGQPEEYEGDYLLPEDGFRYNQMSAQEQFQMLFGNFVYGTASTAFRKELFELCGTYDDVNYTFCQDGYLFLHILSKGYKFNFFDFVSVKHRAGGIANPLPGRPTPNQLALQQDYVTIVQRQLLPVLDTFPPHRQEQILRHYFYYCHRLVKYYPDCNVYSEKKLFELAPQSMKRFVAIKRKDYHNKLKIHSCKFYSMSVLGLVGLAFSFVCMKLAGVHTGAYLGGFMAVLAMGLSVFSLVAAGRFLYGHLHAAHPVDVLNWLKANIQNSSVWSALLITGISGVGFIFVGSYLGITFPQQLITFGIPFFMVLFGAGVVLSLLRLALLLWDHTRSVIVRR